MTTISFISPKLDNIKASNGLLCLFCFEEKMPLTGFAGLVDWRLRGQLSKLLMSDFITGKPGESLLFPLGNRLPASHLLLTGLGLRKHFNETRFDQSLVQMFHAADDLQHDSLTMTLPGRPEQLVSPTIAINSFLHLLNLMDKSYITTLIDTYDVQQDMLPEIERWRMKSSVHPAPLTMN